MLDEFSECKSSASVDANKQVNMVRHDFDFTKQAMVEYAGATKARKDIPRVPLKERLPILWAEYNVKVHVEYGMSPSIVPFFHGIIFLQTFSCVS